MAGGEAADGTTVLFGMGITDNAFTVAATRSSWDIVTGKDTESSKIPITIKFGDGSTTTSRYGGYRDGFEQGVWGTWHGKQGTEADSLAAFEMMRKNGTAEVIVNGKTVTTVDFGMPGLSYIWMKNCLKSEREKRGG